MTPVASPVGDAAPSLLPRRGTTEGTSATHWLPNALCPLLLKAYTRSECTTLVQWFKVELAIKLNKTANGV